MTEKISSGEHQTATPGERRSPGKFGLLPKVTFGLGAAALAGAVVVTVPAAPAANGAAGTATVTVHVGLGAAINAVTGTSVSITTCCGGHQPELQQNS
jgi:hypothetical protein